MDERENEHDPGKPIQLPEDTSPHDVDVEPADALRALMEFYESAETEGEENEVDLMIQLSGMTSAGKQSID